MIETIPVSQVALLLDTSEDVVRGMQALKPARIPSSGGGLEISGDDITLESFQAWLESEGCTSPDQYVARRQSWGDTPPQEFHVYKGASGWILSRWSTQDPLNARSEIRIYPDREAAVAAAWTSWVQEQSTPR